MTGSAGVTGGSSHPLRRGPRIRAPLLILLAALAVAYSVPLQPIGCNQTAHYALVKALAAGTPQIDRWHEETCDAAYIDGHYYAAKAPGLAIVSLPWYLALKAIGAPPANPGAGKGFPTAMLEMPRRAVWQVRLWSVVLPALVLTLLVARLAERLEPGTGLTVAATLALGTMLLPFATDYFVHPLSAALGFGAFAVLFFERRRSPAARWVVVAGLLTGLAAVAEYSVGLIALVLAPYAAARAPSIRRALAYSAGVIAAASPIALFNLWSLGRVDRFPYEAWVTVPGATGHDVIVDAGFQGLDLSSPHVALELLFAEKGLFVLTPVLAAAIAGLVLLGRSGRLAESLVAIGVAATLLVFSVGLLDPFGGFVPGPRYLVPAIPFLAIGLATAYRRFPMTTGFLAIGSAGAMVLATAAEPMLGGDDTASWLRRWERADFTQSVLTMIGAGHGWVAITPFLAAIAIAAVAAAHPLGFWPLRGEVVHAIAALAAWVLLIFVSPKLLDTDKATGEWWGALALVVLVIATSLIVARARHVTVIAGLPLVALLAPGITGHTKRALAVAALSLASAVAVAAIGRARQSQAPQPY